jgi:hypothetical protein
MTTFMVEVTPPEPGEERDEEADAAFEREALWRALQDALDRQKLGGAFRVLGPLPENPCGEVPLEPAGMVPPPDQLKAFFAELRATAQDSLTLLRIMGVPSNAKVVEVWRKFASYRGSDDGGHEGNYDRCVHHGHRRQGGHDDGQAALAGQLARACLRR